MRQFCAAAAIASDFYFFFWVTGSSEELVRLALAAGAPDNVSCLVARAGGALEGAVEREPRLEKVILPVEPSEPVSSRAPTLPPSDETAGHGPLARLRAFFHGSG